MQIVLNSNNLFNAIVKLPDNKNLIGTITTLGTDPDFANIQGIKYVKTIYFIVDHKQ